MSIIMTKGLKCFHVRESLVFDIDSQRSRVLIVLKLNVCNSVRKCRRKFTKLFMEYPCYSHKMFIVFYIKPLRKLIKN